MTVACSPESGRVEISNLSRLRAYGALFALLSCAVMQTVFSLGDVGRPVSRTWSARYSNAFSWGHTHDQPIGRHFHSVRRGRAVL